MQNTNLVHSVNAEGPSRVQVGNQYTTNNYHGENHQYDAKKHLAAFRSTDPRHDKTRIEQTNGGLLKDSYIWIIENPEFLAWYNADHNGQVLWIRGDPGKGKTMLLCGLIDELQPSTKLSDRENHISLSFFFCQATNSGLNNAVAVLRGLIYLLVDQQPCLLSHLEDQPEYTATHWNSRVAVEDLFRKMMSDPAMKKAYLVVDALDECLDDLSYLPTLISSAIPRVKWIVSSRNRCEIDEILGRTPAKLSLSLELNDTSVSQAVHYYVNYHTRQLQVRKTLDTERTREVMDYQLGRSRSWEITSTLRKIPSGLNSLYKRMIDQIHDSPSHELYIRLLAIASTVFRPIEFSELLAIEKSMLEKLGVNEDMIPDIITECGSFLTTRGNTIFFVHQSAKDFLLRDSSALLFESGRAHHHYGLFQKSVNILQKLDQDMYNLVCPGVSIEDAILNRPDPDPLEGLVYACVFWAEHLQLAYELFDQKKSGEGLPSLNPAHDFIAEKFLFWLEALSLCGSIPATSKALLFLKDLPVKAYPEPDHLALIEDAHKFFTLFHPAIEEYPLQTYASGLLFSPKNSLIRERFQEYTPDYFANTPHVGDTWSLFTSVFEYPGWIHTVSFSSGGQILVVADEGLIILDSRDCSVQKRTKYGKKRLVAASPDMKWIAAIPYANDVDILEIYELYSTNPIRTSVLGNQKACSIDVSPDSRFLGVCYEKKVEIYDFYTFKTGIRQVRSFELEWDPSYPQLSFSPDCAIAVVWTDHCTSDSSNSILGWVLDCRSGVRYKILPSTGLNLIRFVKFVPDSHLVLICTGHERLFVWDFLKGTYENSKPSIYDCNSLAFSHACSWVVLVVEQKLMLMLYDHQWWTLIKEIELPDQLTNDRMNISVAYDDQTISLFNGQRVLVCRVSELLAHEPSSRGNENFQASNDGRLVACVSGTEVRVVDATTGNNLSTLMIPGTLLESLSFSPQGQNLVFRNESSIFTWDWEKDISYRCPITSVSILDFAVSDTRTTSRNLVAGHDGSSVFVWDIMAGKLERSIVSSQERREHVTEVTFVGSQLAVSWYREASNATPHIEMLVFYDIETGEHTSRIQHPSLYPDPLRISPNGKLAVFNYRGYEELVISDLEAGVHSVVVDIVTSNCFFINDSTISVDEGLFNIDSVIAGFNKRSTPGSNGQIRTSSPPSRGLPKFVPVIKNYGYQKASGFIQLDRKPLLWVPFQCRPSGHDTALLITGYDYVTMRSPSGLHCIRFKART
ncbi:hypothetical protein LB507_004342 [Fusarium sp. FIESC RH6]|nr:hypothetical protein LB507_004342 [Fusarium sp. FIESC RH6]